MMCMPFNLRRSVLLCSPLLVGLLITGCGGSSDKKGSGSEPVDVSEPSIEEPGVAPGTPNNLPTADAGDDQSAAEGQSVSLRGSAYDADGTIASFQWQQLLGPVVTLSGATSSAASFVAPAVDVDTELRFKLTVTDDRGGYAADTVIVTVAGTGNVSAGSAASRAWKNAQVATETAGRDENPITAINENHQAVILWSEYTGTRTQLRAQWVDVATGVSAPAVIVDGGDLDLARPLGLAAYERDTQTAVAVDAAGNALALFVATPTGATQSNLYAVTYSADSQRWSSPSLIASGGSYPDIQQTATGVTISYIAANQLWVQPYAVTGAGIAFQVSTTAITTRSNDVNDDGPYYDIAVSGDTLHVVWSEADDVQYRQLDTTGTLTATALTVLNTNAEAALNPQIGVGTNGQRVVAWVENDFGGSTVKQTTYINNKWVTPQSLELFTAPPSPPTVLFDSNDYAHVIFTLRDNQYPDLYHARHDTYLWTLPELVSNTGATQLSAAADGAGHIMLSFQNDHVRTLLHGNGLWLAPDDPNTLNGGSFPDFSMNTAGLGINAWVSDQDDDIHYALLR